MNHVLKFSNVDDEHEKFAIWINEIKLFYWEEPFCFKLRRVSSSQPGTAQLIISLDSDHDFFLSWTWAIILQK